MTTQTLEFRVGSGIENSPTAGLNIWQIPLFRNSIVSGLSVNSVPEYQSTPTPNYIHNYVDMMITRVKSDGTANNWETDDKIEITITQP